MSAANTPDDKRQPEVVGLGPKPLRRNEHRATGRESQAQSAAVTESVAADREHPRAGKDSPVYRLWPPVIYGGYFLAAWLLGKVKKLTVIPTWYQSTIDAERMAGLVLLALGLAISFWGIVTFMVARTGFLPGQSSTAVVSSGPYRVSRNPMYVGATMTYVGVALMYNLLWPLLLLPGVIWMMQWAVIAREEEYLERKFGLAYQRYRHRVRRWL